MSYFEVLLSEISQYKKDPNLSAPNLLMFALDFAHAEDKPNGAMLRQLKYVQDNSTKELLMPLSVMEYIFDKNKHSPTTSKLITYRTNTGLHRTVTLSQLITQRSQSILSISKIINDIAKQYEMKVKIHKGKGDRLDDFA